MSLTQSSTPVTFPLLYLPSLTLCQDFLSFFTDKITALRSAHSPTALDPISSPPIPTFDHFEPVSLALLTDIVTHLRPTNCASDHIPSHLLKDVFDSVGTSILLLMNTCLSSGHVPAAFKHAVVQPLLKKKNLDPSVLSDFRPIFFI